VEDHLGLVRKIARQFLKPGEYIEDSEVYSDGLLGLLKATKTYRPERQVVFSTYAYWLIYREIVGGYRKRNRYGKSIQLLGDKDVIDETDGENSEAKESCKKILNLLASRNPEESDRDWRNKQILVRRYLFGDTWKSIGKRFHISKQGAQFNANEAVQKIRRTLGIKIEELFISKAC
jgi:RNA polymerase sigma factor (sigma-70 family)